MGNFHTDAILSLSGRSAVHVLLALYLIQSHLPFSIYGTIILHMAGYTANCINSTLAVIGTAATKSHKCVMHNK